MKKLLAIFLAAFFTISALGMEVTVHHCQGKTAYTFLGIDFNKHCKCKHEKESHQSRCCNNHTISLSAATDPYVSPSETISFQAISLEKVFLPSQTLILPALHTPIQGIVYAEYPPGQTIGLNTLFCVFRI